MSHLVEPICRGRRCIVVGSAPNLVMPTARISDVVIGANGGASLARRPVDVLATTSYLFRANGSTRAERETKELMRGLNVVSIWVDEKTGPATPAIDQLKELGCTWRHLYRVSPKARESVVVAATGQAHSHWVSTGVWAACLAVVSGATSVIVVGVSLAPGHIGMSWDRAPRHHADEDGITLYLLKAKGVEVSI